MKKHICIRCNIEKELNKDNFPISKGRFKTFCKECNNKRRNIQKYESKYGIIIDEERMFHTYTPTQWWEFMYLGTPNGKKLKLIPDEIDNKDNAITILKHVFVEILNLKDFGNFKLDLLKEMNLSFTLKYFDHNLQHLTKESLGINLKEYTKKINRIHTTSPLKWNSEKIITQIGYIMEFHSIEDILENKITNKTKKEYNLDSISQKFNGMQNLFIWYFKKKNILLNGKPISLFDFKKKGNSFYSKDTYIDIVKEYALNNDIALYINNTKKLKEWCKTHWNADTIDKISTTILNKYFNSLYDLLIECFPIIQENKVLFEWEAFKSNKWNEIEFRNLSLRELIIHRFDGYDKDKIPELLNVNIVKCSKYDSFYRAMYKYYDNYNFYEWSCDAFPEFKYYWNESSFIKTSFIGVDGKTKLNSSIEKKVFDYIYQDLGIKEIKGVGLSKTYRIDLPKNSIDKYYFPDFIIENSSLKKQLIIELYGFYQPNRKEERWVKYNEKIIRKNKFYKNNDNFYFIDLYPKDIRRNFQGVKNKLSEFLPLGERGEIVGNSI